MDVVRELADRIIVLHNGALVADGEPAEVMASAVWCRRRIWGRAPRTLRSRLTATAAGGPAAAQQGSTA
jgi:branched-chain amino acid transport system ATP-binding protein